MTIHVPATSANLGPGFDTLGIAIELENKVTITKSKFFSLSIKGEGSDRKRFKNNNLFVHIFYKIYTQLNQRRDNFRFKFFNEIPISRGLGSSSAIITSAVAAAYYLHNKETDKNIIVNKSLSFENHPDNIAPAVHGGFTVSIVENEKVYTQKKNIPDFLRAVVVIPRHPMSTAKSRNILPKEYNIKDIVYNVSRSSFLTATILNENWELLRIASKDKLHQDMRMSSMKELYSVQKCALENGALMSTLSGSGSSFFNMVYKDDVKNIVNTLKIQFPHFRIESFAFNNIGLKVNF